MSETNPLVGTWKLKSFETRTSDGSVLYPWGRETVGYVIFSSDRSILKKSVFHVADPKKRTKTHINHANYRYLEGVEE